MQTRRSRSYAPGPDVDPIGSEGWARNWRGEMQEMLASGRQPDRLTTFVKLGTRWRVWALLKRRNGMHFRSIEELCTEPTPYGLGCGAHELSPRGGASSRRALAEPPSRRTPRAAVVEPPSGRSRRTPARSEKTPVPRREPKSKPPRKTPKEEASLAHGLPERVQRRLTLLRKDVAEALARGEFDSVGAATRAARSRKGPDPVPKILEAVKKLSKIDRVRLGMHLVELGLFAKR